MSYIIEDKQIYDVTDNGRKILTDLFGDIRPGKNFSEREDDSNPSASIWQHPQSGIWGVKDFAVGKWRDAITVYMEHENMSQGEVRFSLADKYGIDYCISPNRNKAKYECRTATENDGFSYIAKEKFSESELKLIGPNVKQEHCDMLGWKSLVNYSWVSDGKLHTLTATDTYPIFMRILPMPKPDALQCFKLYQPLSPDVNHKHFYMPTGTKPEDYVNGLAELQMAYKIKNEKEKKKWEEQEVKEGEERKPYKPSPLPAAAICCGDRDALCCLSMGIQPIWLNSETATLSQEAYKAICNCVSHLYSIPDTDETGRQKGCDLALTYPDILTAWLPNMNGRVKDFRGKRRKDLQGWMELHPQKDAFKDLLKKAMPARFWGYDESGKPSGIEIDGLYYFLTLHNIYAYRDPTSLVVQYVRKNKYVVQELTAEDIRLFVLEWVKQHQYSRRLVRDIMQSGYFSDSKLPMMERIPLKFQNFTEESQMFFFSDYAVTVTADSITPVKLKDYKSDCCVWEKHVFTHSFRLLSDMFEVTYTLDDNDQPVFDIKVNKVESNFLGYLINSSRLFWRKELEDNLEDKTEEERAAYLATHKFDISGEGLSEKERHDQVMCLLNKLFTLGYLFHQYKDPARAWAVYSMDNKIGDVGQCNGRTGKSFFFKFLEKIITCDTISGQIKDPKTNKHLYERVTPSTRLVIVDDCRQGLRLGDFYPDITGSMTVDVKNVKSYMIEYEDSPKMAFTTNYVPQDFDPSTMARLLPMVYSDYYHEATFENDYLETRSVMHDFGHSLYTRSYSEEDWNGDLNLVLQATRFYLWVMKNWPSYKIQPPMENIMLRKYKQDMGENFENWAAEKLCIGSSWLDNEVPREVMFNNYNYWLGDNHKAKLSPQGFIKHLRAYCMTADYIDELNPEDMLTDKKTKRILRFIDGKTTEVLYIKTKDAPF